MDNPFVIELGRLPGHLEALLAGRSEGELRARPGGSEWSAKEIAGHLGDAARIYHERVFLTATHERPTLASYDEAALARDRNYQEADTSAILPNVRTWREETVHLLSGLPAEAWDRVAVHEETGEMTLVHLVAHMIEHEADHLRGIARLLNVR